MLYGTMEARMARQLQPQGKGEGRVGKGKGQLVAWEERRRESGGVKK